MNLPTVRLYNTLTRRREELKPLAGDLVRIYSCGPTVYRYAHVGNLRTFMLPDLLRRTLEYLGYRTEQAMNITDVGHLTDDMFERGEDKMLVAARLENKSTEEIASAYTEAFLEDTGKLNIRPATRYPRATDYVPRMIELVEQLIAKERAYLVEGNVYFDISTFPTYGKLSRNTIDKLIAGHRDAPDRRKRHPADFTLWKAAGERRAQVWDSPWGPGFPGWHIECSAMSMSIFGDRFDIHTGGADNVFPHHESEIAQSESIAGHAVVQIWMHGGLLMLAGSRMAKSAGNFFRITELEEQGFDPLAFRYLALQAKYRAPLNFSTEGLAGADRALRQLRARIAGWSDQRTSDAVDQDLDGQFREAIADDLDLPRAMALVAAAGRSPGDPGVKVATLAAWDRVLGLDLVAAKKTQPSLPAGAAELIAERDRARAAGDFARSDALREELEALGVKVTDRPIEK